VGAPAFTEDEQAFARSIQHECGVPPIGLATTAGPLRDPDPNAKTGSTDVAEVSWIVPLVHLDVATAPTGAPWHSWAVVACAGGTIGEKGMIVAAKTLALTTLDLLLDPGLVERMKEEHRRATEGKPFVSPIPEGQAVSLPSGTTAGAGR
jgi:aminobenzoyl-glutamate utilization protein B